MANLNLADTQNRADFFSQTVLANLNYWQEKLKTTKNQVDTLDRARESIIRAISFALDLQAAAWLSACALIEQFSPFMERRGHWESWGRILCRALTIAQNMEDTAEVVCLSALLARLRYRQSRYRESVAYSRKTIRLTRQIGDRYNMARTCSNLGYYYVERGQYLRAEVLCRHALAIFEQLDDNHGRAHTHNHLGVLYQRQNCFAEAKQHLERACDIWRAMDDSYGLIRGLINLSLLYLDSAGQPDKTLSYFRKRATTESTTWRNNRDRYNLLKYGDCAKKSWKTGRGRNLCPPGRNYFSTNLKFRGASTGLGCSGEYLSPAGKFGSGQFISGKGTANVAQSESSKGNNNHVARYSGIRPCQKNRPQAAARLNEAQQLMESAQNRAQYRHLQPQIEKIRRSLSKD